MDRTNKSPELKKFKTFKYRLYPDEETQNKFRWIIGKCNWIYNYFLEQRIKKHQQGEKVPSDWTQRKELTQIRQNDFDLKKIHTQVCSNIIYSQLSDAWKTYRKKLKSDPDASYPRPKKDLGKDIWGSFGYTQLKRYININYSFTISINTANIPIF